MTDVRSKMGEDHLFIHCYCGMEKFVVMYDEEIDMWDICFESTSKSSLWFRLKLAYKYVVKNSDTIWPSIMVRRYALRQLIKGLENELMSKAPTMYEDLEDMFETELDTITKILKGKIEPDSIVNAQANILDAVGRIKVFIEGEKKYRNIKKKILEETKDKYKELAVGLLDEIHNMAKLNIERKAMKADDPLFKNMLVHRESEEYKVLISLIAYYMRIAEERGHWLKDE